MPGIYELTTFTRIAVRWLALLIIAGKTAFVERILAQAAAEGAR